MNFTRKDSLKRHIMTKKCSYINLEFCEKSYQIINILETQKQELENLKQELENKDLMLSHQKMLLQQIQIQDKEYKTYFGLEQENLNQELINYYYNKNNIFYAFLFKYHDEIYCKFGLVGELREFKERIKEHKTEFKYISFFNVIQCSNIHKVESEFKETSLYNMNKVKIPKKCGIGEHIEIIKLNEFITQDVIKEEMINVAGQRILS